MPPSVNRLAHENKSIFEAITETNRVANPLQSKDNPAMPRTLVALMSMSWMPCRDSEIHTPDPDEATGLERWQHHLGR